MDFSEWEPLYTTILDDLGIDRGADERGRDRLAALTTSFDLDRLALTGEAVVIVGGGSIGDDAQIGRFDRVIAAGGGIKHCQQTGTAIDLAVTDLDTDPETVVSLTRHGTPVAVAAHGDNIPAVERYVPAMDRDNVLPTTQAEPVAHVVNAGGFTDGDRAAFLADHCGAGSLTFLGWEFDDADVNPMKSRKLQWAKRLLRVLEQRRHERFSVLDEYRTAVDTDDLKNHS
ncbi:hypothetical protein [Halocatena pleomorpha]|uniref:6-hydroxymethyl-7,8-dihydropterin pyrophosphokinase n=1 Tax=Halocatena pleomorpha TaxID=1785090 RepID=A0A3P3R6F1_9EURY|nr:hypothetical protein [Halocatena pleomorpha]RRJ29027.1 hypothetical protein EIK79_14035 [Halocatena pleomorpha]